MRRSNLLRCGISLYQSDDGRRKRSLLGEPRHFLDGSSRPKTGHSSTEPEQAPTYSLRSFRGFQLEFIEPISRPPVFLDTQLGQASP